MSKMSKWRQGEVLSTERTMEWSTEEREIAQARESREIYEHFLDDDQGRSRVRVATCATAEDAAEVVRRHNAAHHDHPTGLVHKAAFEQIRRECDEARAELRRAHAAIRWFAKVRSAIMGSSLRADEGRCRELLSTLAVAHAASEVWLAGDPTANPARAIADLLGWHEPKAVLVVNDRLRPLQTGPYPKLVREDRLPNIEEEDQ